MEKTHFFSESLMPLSRPSPFTIPFPLGCPRCLCHFGERVLERGEGHGSGRLKARTMKAAIAWRLTGFSGQKISGLTPQPVVIPRR
jgi:hypothetical protein